MFAIPVLVSIVAAAIAVYEASIARKSNEQIKEITFLPEMEKLLDELNALRWSTPTEFQIAVNKLFAGSDLLNRRAWLRFSKRTNDLKTLTHDYANNGANWGKTDELSNRFHELKIAMNKEIERIYK